MARRKKLERGSRNDYPALRYPNGYLILDFGVVWSLSLEEPKQYTFDYWMNYINLVQKEAKECNVTLRQVDKALWQYSKEEQKI